MEKLYLSYLNFNWIPLKDYLGQLAFETKDAYVQWRIDQFCICPPDGPIVDTLLTVLTTIKTSPHQMDYKHETTLLEKLPSEIQNFYEDKIPHFSNELFQILKTIYTNSERNIKFKTYFNKEHVDQRHTLIYSFCKLYPEAYYIINNHIKDFTNYVSYDIFLHFYDFIYVKYNHLKHWSINIKAVLYRFIRVLALLIYNGYYTDGILSVLSDFDEILQNKETYSSHDDDDFKPTKLHFKIFCENFWPFDITIPNLQEHKFSNQMDQLGSTLIDAAMMLKIDPILLDFAMGYSKKPTTTHLQKISIHDTFAIPWRIAQSLNKGFIKFDTNLKVSDDLLIYFNTYKVANPEWMVQCFRNPHLITNLKKLPIKEKSCEVIDMRRSILLQQTTEQNDLSKFIVFKVDPNLHKENVNNFTLLAKRTHELYFIENYTLFKKYYYDPVIHIWVNCTKSEKQLFINIINHIFPSSNITITDLKDLWVHFYWLNEDLYLYLYSFVTCFTTLDITQLKLINPISKSNQIQTLEKLMDNLSVLGRYKPLTQQCLHVYQAIYNIKQKLKQYSILFMDDCTILFKKQYQVLFNKLYIF
jgi:hypothetical protein